MTRYRCHPGNEPQVWPVLSCPELLSTKRDMCPMCSQLSSQLMCPPLSFTLKFQPAPPPPTPSHYSIETVYKHILRGWMVGWRVGGGNPSLLFIMTQWGLPGGVRCCSNFHEIVDLNLFSIPVKIVVFLYVVCEECTVFVVWDGAQSIFVCRWYVLKWWYYLHFYDIHFLGNSTRKKDKGVYTGLGTPFFSNRYVTFFSVIFTMVISLEKYENCICVYTVSLSFGTNGRSFLLLPTLPPLLLDSTKS